MNPNIAKRLEKEKEENKKPAEFFYIQPLDNDMYTWHFTLKGITGSNYENGLYHGHVILPKDYPLNPPDIYFHNHNGRFEPHVRICLNITGYHKESWSPIWSIRKMMEALCAYFLVDEGGIGSIVRNPAERKRIADASRPFACDKCGPLIKIEALINGSTGVNPSPAQNSIAPPPAKAEASGKEALGKRKNPKKESGKGLEEKAETTPNANQNGKPARNKRVKI